MRRVRLVVFATSLLTVIALMPGAFERRTVRAQAPVIQPKSAVAVNFAESIPLRDLPSVSTSPPIVGENDYERFNKELPKSLNATETGDPDGAVVTPLVAAPSPPALFSFEGLSNQDNLNNHGFRLSPPDNDGEVGPNHFVQYINLLFRVYDKAGAPLTGPIKLSTLYAPLGGQCAQPDNGDPIVLYDQLADRWLLSQFGFNGLAEPPYHECIAISKTGDPTGAYYLYDFLVPTAQFNDYPKLGVWPDGYYMTANQFNRGGPFDGTGAFAFNRAKMIAGDPTANMIYFDLNLATHPEAIGGMLPSDLDGLNTPPPGSPNVFAYFLATEFLDPIDGIRFFDFHADFETPSNSTFIERQAPLPVPAFDPRTPAGRADIEQPPPSVAAFSLDSISDRFMHRLAYRNFGTHESLVVNHTVNVGTGITQALHQGGVRYYELRRTLPTGPFGVHVAETIAPDTTNRWMASTAQDNVGNIANGYSVSSLTVFPGIRYSGRLADGSPRTEASIIEGSGVQRSINSRWGDYTALSVDPVDDCTFWYTNEYYTAASQASSTVGWLTRNGAFRYPECTPAPRATLTGRVMNPVTGQPIPGALVDLGGGRITTTGPDGVYTIYLLPGSWMARVTAPNHATTPRKNLRLTNGSTVIQDFLLAPTGADVFITKTGPAQSVAFVDLAYQITVGNNGPVVAGGVTVFDAVPPGATFVSAVTSQGQCSTPPVGGVGIVTCNLGALAVGGTATVAVTLHSTDAAGRVVNSATVTSGNQDAVTRNNTATVTTRITCGGDITVTAGPIGTAAVNGLQPGRLFRNGAPSLCGFPKTFPGYSSATDRTNRRFDLYSFTNDGTSAECITVEVTAAASCSSNLLFAAAYLNAYNPADLGQDYLADSGSSPVPALGAPTVAFSFDVPAGATFKLVIHEVNPPPASCGGYSFTVRGLPQACPAPSLAASAQASFSSKPAEPAEVAYSSVPQR